MKVKKNGLLSGVSGLASLMLLSGYGLAADLPVKAAPRAPAPAPVSWNGLYIGGHIVYGDGGYTSSLVSFSGKKNYKQDLNLSGLGVGLHAGYNWQMSQWVYGIEGDVTATPWKNGGTAVSADGKKTSDINASLSYLSTIRGRLGVAFDRTLVYATGGVAFAQSNYQNVQNSKKGPTTYANYRHNDVGGVAGGGVEYKYNSNLSLRLEGLYYFFDDKVAIQPDPKKSTTVLTSSLNDVGVVRLGASWSY
jgi:outer membrane immunogenic protein